MDDTFDTAVGGVPPEHPAPVRYRPSGSLPALARVPRALAVDGDTGAEVELAEYVGLVDPDRLLELAALYRAVESPFVAPLLEVLPDPDGRAVVTVEAHPGGPRVSAAAVLTRRGAVLVGADVASGLAALHDAGLLHGAVSPDAVALGPGARPVLVGAGTPLLAAAGREELPTVGTAEDLHGLGAVLHQLLVGAPPAEPPVPPVRSVPDLEPSLNGLILALLSRDPERPPPPAGAVARRLRALADGEPRPLPVTVTTVADGIERGLAELAVYALFAALALVGVVAAFAATREDDPPAVATVTETAPAVVTLAPPPTVPLGTTPVATVTTELGPDEDGVFTETSVETVASVETVTETVATTETVPAADTAAGTTTETPATDSVPALTTG